jgi:hypothetical protein
MMADISAIKCSCVRQNAEFFAIRVLANAATSDYIGHGMSGCPGSRGAAVACRVEGRDEAVHVDLNDDVPANHKFAFADIKADDPILSGLVIGEPVASLRPPAGPPGTAGQLQCDHAIQQRSLRGCLADAQRLREPSNDQTDRNWPYLAVMRLMGGPWFDAR